MNLPLRSTYQGSISKGLHTVHGHCQGQLYFPFAHRRPITICSWQSPSFTTFSMPCLHVAGNQHSQLKCLQSSLGARTLHSSCWEGAWGLWQVPSLARASLWLSLTAGFMSYMGGGGKFKTIVRPGQGSPLNNFQSFPNSPPPPPTSPESGLHPSRHGSQVQNSNSEVQETATMRWTLISGISMIHIINFSSVALAQRVVKSIKCKDSLYSRPPSPSPGQDATRSRAGPGWAATDICSSSNLSWLTG